MYACLSVQAIAHFEYKIQEGQGKQVSRCRSASPEVTLSASRASQPCPSLEVRGDDAHTGASDAGEARPCRTGLQACDGQEQVSQAGQAAGQAAADEAQPARPQQSPAGDAEEPAWVAEFRRGISLDGGGGGALQVATRKEARGHACSVGGGAQQAERRGNALGLRAAAGRPARPAASSARGERSGDEPGLERSPGGGGAAAVGRWGRKRHRGEARWDAALVPVQAKPPAAPDSKVVPGARWTRWQWSPFPPYQFIHAIVPTPWLSDSTAAAASQVDFRTGRSSPGA